MIAESLAVSRSDRGAVERMARSTVLPHRTVRQARGLFWAADGVANEEIARALGRRRRLGAPLASPLRRVRCRWRRGNRQGPGAQVVAAGGNRGPGGPTHQHDRPPGRIDAVVDPHAGGLPGPPPGHGRSNLARPPPEAQLQYGKPTILSRVEPEQPPNRMTRRSTAKPAR
jgi:hypothetical protein